MRKPVVGYEDYYEISDSGEVFRKLKSSGTFVGKKLKPFTIKGYKYIKLNIRGKIKLCSIHRMIAEAWIPNPKNLPQVNHLDCNKENNSINNLEWCTPSENTIHAHDNNLWGNAKNARKPVIGISLYDEKIIEYESVNAAEKDGFRKGNISKCALGKMNSYKGYKWYHKCTATSSAQSILHERG